MLETRLDGGIQHHTVLASRHALQRGIQRHLDTIEVVPLESRFQHGRVVVASDADEARELFVAHLVEGVQHAVLGLDLREIVRAHQGVHVNQINLVGL